MAKYEFLYSFVSFLSFFVLGDIFAIDPGEEDFDDTPLPAGLVCCITGDGAGWICTKLPFSIEIGCDMGTSIGPFTVWINCIIGCI